LSGDRFLLQSIYFPISAYAFAKSKSDSLLFEKMIDKNNCLLYYQSSADNVHFIGEIYEEK
jgi:hypothetical protein